MKKLCIIITGSVLLIASHAPLSAQCNGNRYHDFIFSAMPDSTVNVAYGYNVACDSSPDSLKLDVYQPHGDTAAHRALIIFAHGGRFAEGNKWDMAKLCQDFAKMGYVTATIDYRLFMTNLPIPGPDSNDAGAAIIRAVQDARAAVRFFRKNATIGGNTYKIDTNNIFFGGESAGGFIALGLAYMDQLSEMPNYIDTTGVTVGLKTGQPGLHGGIEGLSGNPGYSSKVKAIINLSGAIVDTAWMHAGDTPVISTHSINDVTVPYGKAVFYLDPKTVPPSIPIQVVEGSSVVAERANQVGIVNCLKIYQGGNHVPENSSIQIYDTTLVLVRNFLEHFTCGVALNCGYTSFPLVTGINELAVMNASINIYPNPAFNAVTVDLKPFVGNSINIDLYDALGQKVKNIQQVKTEQYTITRDNLPNGIYFMNVTVEGKVFSKKIMFE